MIEQPTKLPVTFEVYETAINIVSDYMLRVRNELSLTDEVKYVTEIESILSLIEDVKFNPRYLAFPDASRLKGLYNDVMDEVTAPIVRAGVQHLLMSLMEDTYQSLIHRMAVSIAMSFNSTNGIVHPPVNVGITIEGTKAVLTDNPWLVFCLILRNVYFEK